MSKYTQPYRKMQQRLYSVIILLFFTFPSFCQNTGMGTFSPDPSAKLHIEDTTRGILIPRMTTNQMNAIQSPATGLLIFNQNTESFWYKTTSKWTELSPALNSTGCNTTNPQDYNICADSTGNKLTFYIWFGNKWNKL